MVAIVARFNGKIVAYVLAVMNAARYWKALGWRSPLVACRIVIDRLKSDRGRPSAHELPAELEEHIDRQARQESWSDSDSRIAKILFIGTHPDHQGRGLGKDLYHHCFDELRKRGATRVDARVSLDNVASLHLHLRTGWNLRYQPDAVFATRSL